MLEHYWDIESLKNVFTIAVYKPEDGPRDKDGNLKLDENGKPFGAVDVYVIDDDDLIGKYNAHPDNWTPPALTPEESQTYEANKDDFYGATHDPFLARLQRQVQLANPEHFKHGITRLFLLSSSESTKPKLDMNSPQFKALTPEEQKRYANKYMKMLWYYNDVPLIDADRVKDGDKAHTEIEMNHLREKTRKFGANCSTITYRMHAARHLIEEFGCENEGIKATRAVTGHDYVKDTDPNYSSNIHPYLFAYNSFNYDTVMLALLLSEAVSDCQDIEQITIDPNTAQTRYEDRFITVNMPTAKRMRDYNDALFTKNFKSQMPSYLQAKELADGRFDRRNDGELRRNWDDPRSVMRQTALKSGRYIDVARLNEKQVKVALKRILAMLGHQILESDKLDSHNAIVNSPEELIDLIAYNVSDVIGTYDVFHNDAYLSQFEIKSQLLENYPELIYETDDNGGVTCTVRRNRLYIDSSSQQLTSRALCPDDHLNDSKTVDFHYPHQDQVSDVGLDRQLEVLDDTRDFFLNDIVAKFPPEKQQAPTEAFAEVYNYYNFIRGKNFDESKYYTDYYGNDPDVETYKSSAIPPTKSCIVYYDGNGNPTSCYANFSIGGVHGAEYNKALYDADVAEYKQKMKWLTELQDKFGDDDEGALNLRLSVRTGKTLFELSDHTMHEVKEFLAPGFTKSAAKWRTFEKPELFETNRNSGTQKLRKRYNFTSAALTNHEDFTSYYPNLLRRMQAFYNEKLGYDRYGEMFQGKQEYGAQLKQPGLSDEEKTILKRKYSGVKLFLNSASGGGDASFDTPVRMNNRIIAMRAMGQLFSWSIAQAQAAQGARVVSTNTDGLYTVLEEKLNNAILEKESKRIGVEIEPEPIYLISKDTNNRIEFKMRDDANKDTAFIDTYQIVSCAGGQLAGFRGPDPTKSLSHPAIIDWVLAHYLVQKFLTGGQDAYFDAYDEDLGMKLLKYATTKFEPVHLLRMFQHILCASPGSMTYPTKINKDGTHSVLQHYNRVFIVNENTPDAINVVNAAAVIVTPAMLKTRARLGKHSYDNNPDAARILESQGVNLDDIREDGREATFRKYTGIDENWPLSIHNESLFILTEQQTNAIRDSLNLEIYNSMVRDVYEQNWRNAQPQEIKIITAESLKEN